MDLIKSISLQGQICQRIKHRSLPQLVKGQLAHGKLPEQIWQIDYICPLILDKGCPYVCTAVNIYSGYLVTIPFRRVNQTILLKQFEIMNLYYGVLLKFRVTMGHIIKVN